MNLDTASAARGRWASILPALGIDPKYLVHKHGPCPACGGEDRFRFDDKLNGSHYCGQCGHGDGFDLLCKVHSWGFNRAAAEVDRVLGNCPITTERRPERSQADKSRYLRKIWGESLRVAPDDPVWRYLLRRCGDPSAVLDDLRYHPALHHPDGGNYPAMLAGMGFDAATKKFSGIHRTYLSKDGQKAQVNPVRATLGEVGPVRLGPLCEELGIAESIETAICAGKKFHEVVWSAGCAHGVETWVPPSEVKFARVFADNDANFRGQNAAFSLASRLYKIGIPCEVHIPPVVGTDWADLP